MLFPVLGGHHQQDVVPSSRRDLQSALDGFLAFHIGKVQVVFERLLEKAIDVNLRGKAKLAFEETGTERMAPVRASSPVRTYLSRSLDSICSAVTSIPTAAEQTLASIGFASSKSSYATTGRR